MKGTVAVTVAALLAVAPASRAADVANGDLMVKFAGLRSVKGMIHVCLTRDPQLFLHCDKDPSAFKGSIAAGPAPMLEFKDVPPGDYVLELFHDENGNSKLDTVLGIPREGVGFSRNPPMSFGPPKYDAAKFHVGAGASEISVKLKYFL